MEVERNPTMIGGNRFKPAVFDSNCRAGRAVTTVPERWQNTFEDNIWWDQAEFDMFGIEQDGHDDRYARGQELLESFLRLWSEDAPFDDDGRYYQLKDVAGRPRPWGGRRPILMNAGNSVAGHVFGARYCDLVFDQPHHLELARDRILEVRRGACELGKEVQVFTSGAVVC